jgi:two-component system CheB/CheR fusion protein
MARKQRPSGDTKGRARVAKKSVAPSPAEPSPESSTHLPFAIVAIGASAGGIKALTQLLGALPNDTGMAFVVVQHLDASHPSMLSEVLGRATTLPVFEAQDGQAPEPDHVYVLPNGKNIVLHERALHLSPRVEARGHHRPIDLFFRSLAEQQGHRSIGVILSGSANDGTLGLEEIKAAGGITFAQDDTAEHNSMPRSAIAEGCVDFVLPPEDIAHELARLGRHPYVMPTGEAAAAQARNESYISRILDTVRHATGVDFSNYKRNTLQRRITRRMVLHKTENLRDYVRFLQNTPTEADALYQDILINVTSFFRDAEAYDVLKARIFPRLVTNKSRQDQVRVWTLGCSTGEEAYSLAMAYTEYAEASGRRVPMQIFATDLNGACIEKARAGIYPKGIAQDLSPERLRRFFVEIDGAYRVTKSIRDMCIFARQNVLADPPFSRMDLIACRNMLIYLEPVLQQKLLPILHYSLQPSGVLWLGSSETIGSYRDLFDIDDAKNKIYVKQPGPQRRIVRIPHQVTVPRMQRPDPPHELALAAADPQREADRILLQRYAPAGVVVSAELDILQFRGDTSLFLSPAPGKASLNLLKMLREGLLVGVRGAVHKARRENAVVHQDSLRVKTDSGYRKVSVNVIPMSGSAQDGYLLITFEAANGARTQARSEPSVADAAEEREAGSTEMARLRQELDSTRDYLQSLIEQQEAANEELQSANEEVQSANEELQSINEELETSKEEIQSSNEELATVNDELQNRNLELSQSNNDLINLLTSVQMAIVMLGRDLRIRRFTPAAEKILNLIPTDVGRPIGDIKLGLTVMDLEDTVTDVVDSVSVHEELVQDKHGRWYALRVHPYKTLENKIDGAVLLLVDVDQLKRTQFALRDSESRFAQLADSAPVLIWVGGPDGRRQVNTAYLNFVGVPEAELQRYDWSVFIHPNDREQTLELYRERIAARQPFEAQFRFRRADGVYRWMKAVCVPRFEPNGNLLGYIGCKFDVTDLKEAEENLREADRGKNNFLAVLAHELRTPLAAVRNAVQVIGHEHGTAVMTARAKSVIERQTVQMVRMVDDLLDLSRLTRGTFQLRTRSIDLVETVRQAIDVTAHERESKAQELEVVAPSEPLRLQADGERLQQVFANLLSNSVRYTHRGGHVRVSIAVERAAAGAHGEPRGGTATVRVRDDGIGIDAGMLPHVFDLFSQVNRGASMGSGLGIGLNLAKRLVELHGGTITVSSDGKDLGTEVAVRLPLDDAATLASPTETHAPRKHEQLPQQTLRALVVDDSPDAADMLVNLLQLAHQDVRCANNGEIALQLAREFRPHLVLLDIGMPGLDGREVARRMRADPDLRGSFLVAVTGFSPADTALDLGAEGFDERITKPLENEVLLTLVERAMRDHR